MNIELHVRTEGLLRPGLNAGSDVPIPFGLEAEAACVSLWQYVHQTLKKGAALRVEQDQDCLVIIIVVSCVGIPQEI
jgi:hypothetical protein